MHSRYFSDWPQPGLLTMDETGQEHDRSTHSAGPSAPTRLSMIHRYSDTQEGCLLSSQKGLATMGALYGISYLHHGDRLLPFWEVPCSNLRYLHAQFPASILCIVAQLGSLAIDRHMHPQAYTERSGGRRVSQTNMSLSRNPLLLLTYTSAVQCTCLRTLPSHT